MVKRLAIIVGVMLFAFVSGGAAAQSADSTTVIKRMEESPRHLGERRRVVVDTVVTADTLMYVDIVDSEIEPTVAELSTLEAAWAPVLVDHSIGIRGGWGTGSMRREPARESTTLPYSLWNMGISYRFDVPEQKYVGTIVFELNYMQKGFAYHYLYGEPESYSRRFDVLELPILWQPYLPLGKGGSRFYISVGPFFSYTLSSYEMEFNSETGEVTYEGVYKMDPWEDYSWNYGITAGAGFYVNIKRFAISAEFRYTIQLSDITRGPEYIPGNPFRTPVDHMGASLGIHYKFSLGSEAQKRKDLKRIKEM